MISEPDCPFCQFASGAAQPEHPVASGPSWMAFFPLDPATTGHTLVIPREHHEDFWQLPEGLRCDLAQAAAHIGDALGEVLRPEGMNLITSAGAAAEQTVFHTHLHVVPRWRDDDFGRIWPDEGGSDPRQLQDIAQRLGQLLGH